MSHSFLLAAALLCAILISLATTSPTTTPPTSEILWDRYQQVLMSFIKKTNDVDTYKGLQVVTEPLDANWDTEGNEHVLSLLLDSSARYGSVYNPSSLSLAQQYESFIFNLKFPQVASDAKLQDKMWDLRDLLMEQEMRRIQAQNLCYDDYIFFKELSAAYQKMSYKQYEAQECAASMGPIHRELMALNSDLVTLTTKLDGPHKRIVDAVSRYSTDVNVGEYRETKTTLKTFLERARTNAGTPVSFALNSKTELSEKRDWIQKKKSGFFVFKKSSTTVKSEYRFQSEIFEMKISADSMGRIDVAPKGDWFSSATVRAYKNDKSMWIDANKQFFGKSGTMPLLPKTIYVMYNPKVTLEVTEKDAYTLNEMKSSSFTFGPFSKSKGSTLNIEKMDNKNYRVTFESNSNTAHIIAIDHEVFE